ncbi:MAG: tetratricopeptide repeat protein [Calothrix sp. C42_A2020_038]|nr:tetratricopeptide repeat protein [Calothrix sp. C42_A2020_038]
MSSSEKEYFEARLKKTKRLQKMVTAVSIISFFGSTGFAVISTLQQEKQNHVQAKVSLQTSLQEQARGFELVLQREPKNRLALEGLVSVRLQLKDAKGALETLEKLVKLYPEQQNYKAQFELLKNEQSK